MDRKRWLLPLIVLGLCNWFHKSLSLSSLAKNDPYPLFTTSYPYNQLLQATKQYLKGYECEYHPDHFSIALSGIYQKANRGANFDRIRVPLGDLEGRWHMLGMLYGPVPTQQGDTLVGTRLGEAKLALFGPQLETPNDVDSPVTSTAILVDSDEQIGFFTVPIKYRKHGVRFEVAFQPTEDIGAFIQGGWADIKQTVTGLDNLTPEPNAMGLPPGFNANNVALIRDLLMSDSSTVRIFREQCINKRDTTQDICDFREGAFEDLRFSIWLRHIFQANFDRWCEYPEFLFIPFFNFEASISFAPQLDRTRVLAAPFDNNGHNAIGFTSGFHIDFHETLEIGFHGGIMHFTSRHVRDYRLPTHPSQTGIYPFSTDVTLRPGNNHHFCVSLHAYHFLDKLSGWAEFTFVNHDEDNIVLDDPGLESVFRVRQQECLTKFTSQFLTTAGYYDISPNISLGFGVQWPLQQRNSYRSTTVLGTIKATF